MTTGRPKEGIRTSRVYLGVAYRLACLGVFRVFSVLVGGALMAGLCGCTITVQSGPASPSNGYVAAPAPAPMPPTVVYVPVAQPGHVPATPGAVRPPAPAVAPGRRSAAAPAGGYAATGQPSQLPSTLPAGHAPAAQAPAPVAPSSPTAPVARLPLPSRAVLRPPAAPAAPPTPPPATPTPPAASSTPDANAPPASVPVRKGNPRAVKQPESAPSPK
jgi:hypothetical protein